MRRTCVQCGKFFELTPSEIEFYERKNLTLPKRCKECREQNKGGGRGENKAEDKMEGKSGGRAENGIGIKPDNRAENRMGSKSNNKAETKMGGKSDNRTESKTEIRTGNGKDIGTGQGKTEWLWRSRARKRLEKKFIMLAVCVVLVICAAAGGMTTIFRDYQETNAVLTQMESEMQQPDGKLAAENGIADSGGLNDVTGEGAAGVSDIAQEQRDAARGQQDGSQGQQDGSQGQQDGSQKQQEISQEQQGTVQEQGVLQEATSQQASYKFRSSKLLNQHYEKHGIEMGFASAADYEAAASDVINNPNALYKTEAEDGDGVYYIEATNEFVILSTDGYIRTYFYPSGGIAYFNRQ